jgi:hypothetical protein
LDFLAGIFLARSVRPAGRSGWDVLARFQLDGWNTTSLIAKIWVDWIPLPDFGNIDKILSDFGTGKISVMVDCLNVKVDCIV